MPNPNNFKNKKDFLKECVPQAIKEGREQDQAVAMCYSMWKEKKKDSKGSIEIGDNEIIF